MFKWLSELTFGTLLALMVLLVYLSRYVPTKLVEGVDPATTAKHFWLLLPEYGVLLMSKLVPFSFFLSLLLVFGIIIFASRLMKVRDELHDKLTAVKDTQTPEFDEIKNGKWQKVILHINSENPSDWKLAILECDIMLGEILERMGYLQESIGEKLKAVEPSDFTNIEAAWEAHKIRNAVAHEGSEFVINHREAKRIIGLYEVVFREFDYI